MTEQKKSSPVPKGPEVVVVGAGVVGLHTGIEALKKGHRVTIYDAAPFDKRIVTNPELLTSVRASEAAGAQWLPIVDSERSDTELRWIEQSLDLYMEREVISRYRKTIARRKNVELTKDEDRMPPSFLEMSKRLGPGHEFEGIPENPMRYTWGYDFTTLQFNSPAMLDAMQKEFKELGGKLLVRKIESEDEFYDLPGDVLINCMGLQAREIFKSKDLGLSAIKGHQMLFTNPGVEQIVSAEDFILIPRSKDRLIVGCLYLHEGTFSTLEPTPEEQEILRAKFHEVMSFDIEGFEKIRKQFEKAEHVGAITALRPYRKSGVLVSAEVEGGKTVIHHVGHGGAGWTLAPGSAKDAVALIEQS